MTSECLVYEGPPSPATIHAALQRYRELHPRRYSNHEELLSAVSSAAEALTRLAKRACIYICEKPGTGRCFCVYIDLLRGGLLEVRIGRTWIRRGCRSIPAGVLIRSQHYIGGAASRPCRHG